VLMEMVPFVLLVIFILFASLFLVGALARPLGLGGISSLILIY